MNKPLIYEYLIMPLEFKTTIRQLFIREEVYAQVHHAILFYFINTMARWCQHSLAKASC